MKPRLKYQDGQWLCGGFKVATWYEDWYAGDTPSSAYMAWERAQQ